MSKLKQVAAGAIVLSLASSAFALPRQTTPDVFAAPLPGLMDRLIQLNSGEQPLNAACCKRCSKGKPCGDSCISKSYTCRKPPGCAC